MSRQLIQAVAVTAELCGRVMSDAAARVFVADLSKYPEAAVLDALQRCRREVRGALTLADVLARVDDGRPGAEEAWSMIPTGEEQTVVWTEETRLAAGPALRLLAAGDHVAARMAFKESYVRLVDRARAAGEPVRWSVSPGLDPNNRWQPVAEAIALGRLPVSAAELYALPPPADRPREGAPFRLADLTRRRLPA